MIFDEHDAELIHYGVKGMKWGVRKDREPSARRKAKIDKFQSKADTYQQAIDKLNLDIPANALARYDQNQTRKALEKERDYNQKNADAVRAGKLTTNQKYVLVGAAVLAAYGGYLAVESGEASRLISKGKNLLENKSFSTNWKRNENLAKKFTDPDDILNNVVKNLNPEYGSAGTKNNCRRCTYAYELARRGYDVRATRTLSGRGQHAGGQSKIIKDVVSSSGNLFAGSEKIIDSGGGSVGNGILKSLRNEPNGARGELNVFWKMGGGHSLAWEVVNGKPVIFDAQLGVKYSSTEDIVKLGLRAMQAGYTRLDNQTINMDAIGRWVKNND